MAARSSDAVPPEIAISEKSFKAPEVDVVDLSRRQGRTYGKYYAVLGVISLVGYVTTFSLRAWMRVWFAQPHLAHGCLGLLWGAIIVHQITTGATDGAGRRLSHRVVGAFLAPVILAGLYTTGVVIVVRGLALSTDYYGGHVSAHDVMQAYILLHMAVYGTVAFTIAYVAAKRKAMLVHKEMIGFVVAAFADAGLYRIVVMLLHGGGSCDHGFISNNKKAVAHVLTRAIVTVNLLLALLRCKRFTRLNSAMVVVYAICEVPVLSMIKDEFCALTEGM
jgi:hypothetical protein